MKIHEIVLAFYTSPRSGLAILMLSCLMCFPAYSQNLYDITGISIETIDNGGVLEDGVYVASASMPDEDMLVMAYYFVGDPDTTEVVISFNDEPREILNGLPLLTDSIGLLFIDVADVQSQVGISKVTLLSTGTTTAEFMVIDVIEDEGSGVDADGDGVFDTADNCTLVSNTTQLDTNGDGFGNACDPDLNNDLVINFLDISIFAGLFGTGSGGDADFNGDGSVNFLDFIIIPDYVLGPPGPSGIAP